MATPYADLGATITEPEGDLNLGIHLYVDGAAIDAVQLDTSLPGNHTIMVRDPETAELCPGGHPMNPPGVRALFTSARAYLIHGTDARWTIGDAPSKGCIHMFGPYDAGCQVSVRIAVIVEQL